jgi:hypothetical protein
MADLHPKGVAAGGRASGTMNRAALLSTLQYLIIQPYDGHTTARIGDFPINL